MGKSKFFWGSLLFVLLAIAVTGSFYLIWNTEKESERYTVSVIVNDSNKDRWIALKEGLEQAAGDYDITLNLVSTGRFADVEEELALVQREAGNNVDGIILEMVSSEDVYEKLAEAAGNKPIMLLESDISPEEFLPTTSPDNQALGEALAEAVKDDFGEGLQDLCIGILCGNQKQLSQQQRLSGFTKQIQDTGVRISWVLETTEEHFKTEIEEKVGDYPVDILVALENDETERAVDYLQETYRKNASCALYGEGVSEKAVYYLDKGVICVLVVPNEFNMGYQSMQQMAIQLQYRNINAKSSQVDFLVVDKSNLYDRDYQKILFPIVQ